jgi:two-component system cell cycle sensor histidine kinase/response regulator CckA
VAADHHFDMLLTDLVMPQISGPELAQRIQQMHPGIPMLFMSGYSQDVLGPRGALDADAPLMQKPFAAPELLKTIRTLLA